MMRLAVRSFVTTPRLRFREDAQAAAAPALAASIGLGSAVALLVYSVVQLAQAAGHPLLAIDADAIPLFARWRAAALIGSLAALLAAVSGAHRWIARLAAWTALAAVAALVLVVIFAP